MSDYLDPNNEELLKDFFTEAQLMVETLEANVLVLENEPGNAEAVDEIFRAAHTLKGSAATVQMSELASFTHLIEDLLDDIRSGAVVVTSEIIDALLDSIDIIKAMLESRETGEVYHKETKGVTDRLHSFRAAGAPKGGKRSAKEPAKKPPSAQAAETSVRLSEYEILELREAAPKGSRIYLVKVGFNENNPMNSVGGIQVFASFKTIGTVLRTVPDFEQLYEDRFFPFVQYYYATEADDERIRRAATISDVTTSVEIEELVAPSVARGAKREPAKTAAPASAAAPVGPAPGALSQGGRAGAPGAEAKPAPVPQAQARGAAHPEGESQGSPTEPVAGAEAAEGSEEAEERGHDHDQKKLLPKGSILRVDSKRIDVLLNLVSEAVINKAAFNQISSQFAELQNELQNGEVVFRERMKELFASISDALARVKQGEPVKEVRKELMDEFGSLVSVMEPVDTKLKSSVVKFRNTAQNLGRITTELHERVLQIRMVPIAQIFSRFPRLVRDLSRSLAKNVQLIIEGEDTELDKSVIEDLLDPLIHCVRNSIDHGIESPERRLALGKPEEGRILLRARNEGNLIVIEIADDGAGIDVEAVQHKAIARGLIHPSKTLSQIEAFALIFEPGFSTAERVTDISGRGVGLDVVKRQIEKLSGQVSVWSEHSVGTRLTIRLPLTLAIIQGLLIRVGPEIYAIPIASVVESHRVKMSEIKMLDNYEVINVRDDVVSLIRLSRIFKIPTEERRDVAFVVIVGSSDKKIALMVDSLIGEEDVVIKPLRDRYSASPGVAGATILGDGKVALILDVSQLLDLGLRLEREERRRRALIAG